MSSSSTSRPTWMRTMNKYVRDSNFFTPPEIQYHKLRAQRKAELLSLKRKELLCLLDSAAEEDDDEDQDRAFARASGGSASGSPSSTGSSNKGLSTTALGVEEDGDSSALEIKRPDKLPCPDLTLLEHDLVVRVWMPVLEDETTRGARMRETKESPVWGGIIKTEEEEAATKDLRDGPFCLFEDTESGIKDAPLLWREIQVSAWISLDDFSEHVLKPVIGYSRQTMSGCFFDQTDGAMFGPTNTMAPDHCELRSRPVRARDHGGECREQDMHLFEPVLDYASYELGLFLNRKQDRLIYLYDWNKCFVHCIQLVDIVRPAVRLAKLSPTINYYDCTRLKYELEPREKVVKPKIVHVESMKEARRHRRKEILDLLLQQEFALNFDAQCLRGKYRAPGESVKPRCMMYREVAPRPDSAEAKKQTEGGGTTRKSRGSTMYRWSRAQREWQKEGSGGNSFSSPLSLCEEDTDGYSAYEKFVTLDGNQKYANLVRHMLPPEDGWVRMPDADFKDSAYLPKISERTYLKPDVLGWFRYKWFTQNPKNKSKTRTDLSAAATSTETAGGRGKGVELDKGAAVASRDDDHASATHPATAGVASNAATVVSGGGKKKGRKKSKEANNTSNSTTAPPSAENKAQATRTVEKKDGSASTSVDKMTSILSSASPTSGLFHYAPTAAQLELEENFKRFFREQKHSQNFRDAHRFLNKKVYRKWCLRLKWEKSEYRQWPGLGGAVCPFFNPYDFEPSVANQHLQAVLGHVRECRKIPAAQQQELLLQRDKWSKSKYSIDSDFAFSRVFWNKQPRKHDVRLHVDAPRPEADLQLKFYGYASDWVRVGNIFAQDFPGMADIEKALKKARKNGIADLKIRHWCAGCAFGVQPKVDLSEDRFIDTDCEDQLDNESLQDISSEDSDFAEIDPDSDTDYVDVKKAEDGEDNNIEARTSNGKNTNGTTTSTTNDAASKKKKTAAQDAELMKTLSPDSKREYVKKRVREKKSERRHMERQKCPRGFDTRCFEGVGTTAATQKKFSSGLCTTTCKSSAFLYHNAGVFNGKGESQGTGTKTGLISESTNKNANNKNGSNSATGTSTGKCKKKSHGTGGAKTDESRRSTITKTDNAMVVSSTSSSANKIAGKKSSQPERSFEDDSTSLNPFYRVAGKASDMMNTIAAGAAVMQQQQYQNPAQTIHSDTVAVPSASTQPFAAQEPATQGKVKEEMRIQYLQNKLTPSTTITQEEEKIKFKREALKLAQKADSDYASDTDGAASKEEQEDAEEAGDDSEESENSDEVDEVSDVSSLSSISSEDDAEADSDKSDSPSSTRKTKPPLKTTTVKVRVQKIETPAEFHARQTKGRRLSDPFSTSSAALKDEPDVRMECERGKSSFTSQPLFYPPMRFHRRSQRPIPRFHTLATFEKNDLRKRAKPGKYLYKISWLRLLMLHAEDDWLVLDYYFAYDNSKVLQDQDAGRQ
ncbi:unnamed protein product [Amoebophrya sp. A120]|nr:unnamed protein product [Amoebophrya sp. A120]|eukprot:GSA120T00004080001.1